MLTTDVDVVAKEHGVVVGAIQLILALQRTTFSQGRLSWTEKRSRADLLNPYLGIFFSFVETCFKIRH